MIQHHRKKKIFKHTVTVTILTEEENLESNNLRQTSENLGAYMTHRERYGDRRLMSLNNHERLFSLARKFQEIVPNYKIEAELFKIRNDGTFFDDF